MVYNLFQSLSRRLIGIIALYILSIVILYDVTFAWLYEQWMTDPAYSHGFVIPIISLYLVWIKREQLSRLLPQPSRLAGCIVLLACGAFLLVGRVGAVIQLEALSLLLLPFGIVLVLWGWPHLKVLIFPLVYLQFMVPWTDEIFNRIHIYFQLISSFMGGWILQGLGFSVYRDGIYLQLSRITLEVAPECSGVNFIVSVLAIGVPLIYLTQRTWLRGIGVLVSGICITLISNWIRVALAGIMGYYYGAEMLHGPGHILRGVLVAQVGWVELFLVNWLVCRIPSQVKYRLYEQIRPEIEMEETNESAVKYASPRLVAPLLVPLMVFGIYLHFFAMPQPVPGMLQVKTLPYAIGRWHGYDSKWISGNVYYPGMDAELTRTYTGSSGQDIYLYIGYMNSQSAEKRLISYHSKPLHKDSREVSTGLDAPLPHVMNLSLHNMQGKIFRMFFWYRGPSENIAGRLAMKFTTMVNALLYRSNNGAVIIVATEAEVGSETRTLPKELQEFMEVMLPVLYGQPL